MMFDKIENLMRDLKTKGILIDEIFITDDKPFLGWVHLIRKDDKHYLFFTLTDTIRELDDKKIDDVFDASNLIFDLPLHVNEVAFLGLGKLNKEVTDRCSQENRVSRKRFSRITATLSIV